ncbi:MAG: metallophosphoesterase [Candidatus Nanoarchaeia archaeon]|nr:metallophosphoesterase [Candidatus Nanoarchaeia archaeon]MDD5239288.1 metallophosphoesterase [Candidatus Nanoarchaeia archaeon]
MNYKFLKNERAMIAEDFLVVSDLHIGYKKELEARGYSIPNQMKDFVRRIIEAAEKEKVNKLIILGDVKHKVPGVAQEEKYDIPDFFYGLSKHFEKIVVIKGNHDALIEKMVHFDNVEIIDEYIVGKIGFAHGHKWPSREFMKKCEMIVIGHSHPVFKIKDSMGYSHYYPCWMVCRIKKAGIKRYKESSVKNVIVVPPFNQLLTGIKNLAGVFAKALRIEEIFLLDLTKVR